MLFSHQIYKYRKKQFYIRIKLNKKIKTIYRASKKKEKAKSAKDTGNANRPIIMFHFVHN